MKKFLNVHSSNNVCEKVEKCKDCVRLHSNIKQEENGFCYDELVLSYEEYDKLEFEEYKKIILDNLEKHIKDIRSKGIKYNEQLWSIDEECEKNLTSQITMLSFAPTEKVVWFSKSQANELTLDEFRELALTLSQAIANAKMQYYTYKNAIELAQTEEDINAITFE